MLEVFTNFERRTATSSSCPPVSRLCTRRNGRRCRGGAAANLPQEQATVFHVADGRVGPARAATSSAVDLVLLRNARHRRLRRSRRHDSAEVRVLRPQVRRPRPQRTAHRGVARPVFSAVDVPGRCAGAGHRQDLKEVERAAQRSVHGCRYVRRGVLAGDGPPLRSLVLAATFLIDFLYFEDKAEKRRGGHWRRRPGRLSFMAMRIRRTKSSKPKSRSKPSWPRAAVPSCSTSGPSRVGPAWPWRGISKKSPSSSTPTKSDSARVNTGTHGFLAAPFNVRSIPTILFIHDGKVLDAVVGRMSAQQLGEKSRVAAQESQPQARHLVAPVWLEPAWPRTAWATTRQATSPLLPESSSERRESAGTHMSEL